MCFYGSEKIVEFFECVEVAVFGFDRIGALEKETDLRCADHSQIVVTVTSCNRFETYRLQAIYSCELRLFTTHVVADDFAIFGDFERVAKKGRPAELLYEGSSKLLEGVRKDDDLRFGAQFVQELTGPWQWVDSRDDFLDLRQPESVLVQNSDSELHKLIVIRFIPCCPPEFRYAARFGKRYPDFGNEDAFHVQAYDIHNNLLGASNHSP